MTEFAPFSENSANANTENNSACCWQEYLQGKHNVQEIVAHILQIWTAALLTLGMLKYEMCSKNLALKKSWKKRARKKYFLFQQRKFDIRWPTCFSDLTRVSKPRVIFSSIFSKYGE
jgi:hypothetical protein